MRYALLLLILVGCCPTEQVIRPADTIYVPFLYTDTIPLLKVDTVYLGSSEHMLIHIDTLWKKAYVKFTDTLRVIVPPDTVQSPVIELSPTLWNSKRFWVPFSVLGLFAGIGICLYLIKKFKP